MHPAVGWIRADKVSTEDILTEINEVRKEGERLRSELQRYKEMAVVEVPALPRLMTQSRVSGTYFEVIVEENFSWSTTATWKEIFGCVAPYLLVNTDEDTVKSILASSLSREFQMTAINHQINEQDFQTIEIQLMALKLISADYTPNVVDGVWSWSSDASGRDILFRIENCKRQKDFRFMIPDWPRLRKLGCEIST